MEAEIFESPPLSPLTIPLPPLPLPPLDDVIFLKIFNLKIFGNNFFQISQDKTALLS